MRLPRYWIAIAIPLSRGLTVMNLTVLKDFAMAIAMGVLRRPDLKAKQDPALYSQKKELLEFVKKRNF